MGQLQHQGERLNFLFSLSLLVPWPLPSAIMQIESAAKNKARTSYDTVAQLLSRKPHPVLAPGLELLQEAAAAAASWRTKYYTAIGLPAAAAAAAAGVSIAAVAAAAGGGPDDASAAAADAEEAAAAAAAAVAERKAAAEAEAAAAAAAAAAARKVNTRLAALAAVSAAFAGCSSQPLAVGVLSPAGEAVPVARVPEPPSAALAAAAAAAAAAFAGKHFDVQELTELADEVLDIGLELPEQQLLRQRLQEGAALQDQIMEVLSAEGDERYDVHGLRDLQQQANSCGLALKGES
jgi:SWI/SNF-related matrix-associated actin-dependent regulator 1 of chromatin subfamily A